MTRFGAFIFGTASLVASCFLAWYLNGFIFDAVAHYFMTDEVTSDLRHGVVMVMALIAFAFGTEAFYKIAFTRPKIEIILPNGDRA